MEKRKLQKTYALLLAITGLAAACFGVWVALAAGSDGALVLTLAGLAATFLFKAIDLRIASMPDE